MTSSGTLPSGAAHKTSWGMKPSTQRAIAKAIKAFAVIACITALAITILAMPYASGFIGLAGMAAAGGLYFFGHRMSKNVDPSKTSCITGLWKWLKKSDFVRFFSSEGSKSLQASVTRISIDS